MPWNPPGSESPGERHAPVRGVSFHFVCVYFIAATFPYLIAIHRIFSAIFEKHSDIPSPSPMPKDRIPRHLGKGKAGSAVG